MIINNPTGDPDVTNKHDESIDYRKLILTAQRSIWYIIFFLALGLCISYLIVRYTKPLYESTSLIKLDFKSEASSLGLVNIGKLNNDLSEMSGEIELLKSNFFLSKVASAINYDVSYYYYGRYLIDERYKNSPFEVVYESKNRGHYDKKFDLEILNKDKFRISIDGEFQEFGFGELITDNDYDFVINKTSYFNKNTLGKYFFQINNFSSIIALLKENSTIIPDNFDASTIKISFQDYNAIKSKDFLTAIDTLYLQSTKETKNRTIEQKIDFLNTQVELTDSVLAMYDDYFERFTIENMTVDLEDDIRDVISLIQNVDSSQEILQNQIRISYELEALLKNEDTISTNLISLTSMPDQIGKLFDLYQKNKKLLIEKLNSYNKNTFIIQQIELQLQQSRLELLGLIDIYNERTSARVKRLELEKKLLLKKFLKLPSMGTEYSERKRIYALQQSFLELLISTKMNLELTKAGTVTNGVLLSPAAISSTPIKPKKSLVYGIGAVSSIIFSLFFIAIRYLLNNKIININELERLVRVPILGSVPFYDKGNLIINKNSKSVLSESLRTIRTNMDFLKTGKKIKSISVTSTISGEGKTFIAVNMGVIIASANKKVCIIDLDMRKPKVHVAFQNEQSTYGISTVLIGKCTIDDAIIQSNIDNLYYIPSGPKPPNPSELILSSKFDDLLRELKNRFDYVISDTPPVGLVTDGILAMKKSDIQFYVVRANYSQTTFIKKIQDLVDLNGFNDLSVIFNGISRNISSLYDYNGYTYGAYGDGYYEADIKKKKFFPF